MLQLDKGATQQWRWNCSYHYSEH